MERLKLTCTLVRDAETWRAQGVAVPRSLLLTGPPGVGKTEIGRTLANESGLGFLAATTADVKSQLSRSEWQPGQAALRACTSQRTGHPVLDELDIIAPARMGGNDPLTDEIVGQLLQELDGIQSRDSGVFLLAATNHAEEIDRACCPGFRSGWRFHFRTYMDGSGCSLCCFRKAAYLRNGGGKPHPGRHERG
jgi:SpoVK/Ycf46/Vps4 family AAA+-type ATPase